MTTPPRTDKTCDHSRTLPINEDFTQSTTVTMYSPPFHVPEGTTISIDLAAQLADPSGNPALATVGVDVVQCCKVSDSRITDQQTIGRVGPAGSPEHKGLNLTLPNKCSLPSTEGSDLIYYLRLRIASSSYDVLLSYSVA
jgi:hypothetical protein